MDDFLAQYFYYFGLFVKFLDTLFIIPGVSLMSFLAAVFIVSFLINNFLLRGH